ncbi:MAG: DUF3726 domain-containing protein [Boseongicola sp.]|nr:DUF3726 domain-containing protein [Boseongicola sp.]
MTAVWSLNEIEALSRKAARGAGYGWGLAEESGQAVRWLLARGLPGADALLTACQMTAARAPDSCPLTYGCALSDGTSISVVERKVIAPLLVLPFVAWTANRQEKELCLHWSGAAFAILKSGELAFGGDELLPDVATVRIDLEVPSGLVSAKVRHRAEVSCETFVSLSEFAAKTYAPATQASRESGAGAGLTDND